MVDMYGPLLSHVFDFYNRDRFMAHEYQSGNSLLESGNQVGIKTKK